MALMHEALESYESSLGPDNIATINLKIDQGISYFRKRGELDKAEQLIKRATDLEVKKWGPTT